MTYHITILHTDTSIVTKETWRELSCARSRMDALRTIPGVVATSPNIPPRKTRKRDPKTLPIWDTLDQNLKLHNPNYDPNAEPNGKHE